MRERTDRPELLFIGVTALGRLIARSARPENGIPYGISAVTAIGIDLSELLNTERLLTLPPKTKTVVLVGDKGDNATLPISLYRLFQEQA